MEGAQHLACTIEMVNMGKRCDVAVIDEIQMIGDESRGWAWTRALQGVPANEIHLCGDASALPLVRCTSHDTVLPLTWLCSLRFGLTQHAFLSSTPGQVDTHHGGWFA